MTPQEESMIDELVERVRTTPVADKDVEAERHLEQTLGRVPDALYVLTQTVLVQQYGLTQAKAQIEALQNQLEQARRDPQGTPVKSGSFLSRIFGSEGDMQAPPSGPRFGTPTQQGPAGSGGGYQPVNYAPAPQGYPPPSPYGGQAYGPGYAAPGYGNQGMFGGGGGGGFLRGALQTAAGVAAGAMVFQGMEGLFHGFGGHEAAPLAACRVKTS